MRRRRQGRRGAAGRFKKKLDKATSKGVLHKNNAANKKAALAKHVATLKG